MTITLVGFAYLLDERPRARWYALLWIFIGSLMRWNALAASFAPMVLLFQWRPALHWLKRYAIALAVWVGITGAAYGVNELLTDERFAPYLQDSYYTQREDRYVLPVRTDGKRCELSYWVGFEPGPVFEH